MEFWLGLIGVTVGALVSFGTLIIRSRYEARTAEREAASLRNDRRRIALAELLRVVAEDVATFRAQVSPAIANLSNRELAELLDQVKPIVGTAADRVRALSTLVPDAEVRHQSHAVYDAWYEYLNLYSDTLANETQLPMTNHANAASTDAPQAFYAAAHKYLLSLEGPM